MSDAYLICYQRCDATYETVPHIHTEDGIFTVDSELDALGIDHGQKYDVIVLNDVQSFARVNGANYPLFQSCWSCKSRFVGNQNWEWCPKCGESLPHSIPTEALRHPQPRPVQPPRVPFCPIPCASCGSSESVNLNCSSHIILNGDIYGNR